MREQPRTRRYAQLTSVVTLMASLCLAAPRLYALPQITQDPQGPAPIERRPPSVRPATPPATKPGLHHGPAGEHLAQWMNQHSNLTPQQQQQALEHEPGFHDLPQETQQRMRSRLAELDAMTPEQRQRRLAHIEAMERLSPDQRAAVREAMAQLGNLPPEERHTVAQTFRALRDLPAEQRVQAYASGRFGAPLNDNDRTVLMNLLRVEPMLEPAAPQNAPRQPQR